MVPPPKRDEQEFTEEEPQSGDWTENEGEDLDADDVDGADDFEGEKYAEGDNAEAKPGDEEGADEALDELEEEELEMLTEDEAAESLPVDELEELRQMRREAIALESSAESIHDDEFVCSYCFLVKRTTQLANARKKLCRDCA